MTAIIDREKFLNDAGNGSAEQQGEDVTAVVTPADFTVARVVCDLQRREVELDQLTRDFERQRDQLKARIERRQWLRRCHAAGFDVGRLGHFLHLCSYTGDLRVLDEETAENLIRRVAEHGWLTITLTQCAVGSKASECLTEQERDSVIYVLANAKRLPPVVPDPVLPAAAPSGEGPHPDYDANDDPEGAPYDDPFSDED